MQIEWSDLLSCEMSPVLFRRVDDTLSPVQVSCRTPVESDVFETKATFCTVQPTGAGSRLIDRITALKQERESPFIIIPVLPIFSH
jgi:hypothetical protein